MLPLLNLSANTEAEIAASINAGLEVITHTDQVSVPGYTGEGYIIIDPQSGSGAYKLGNIGNGGIKALFKKSLRFLSLFVSIGPGSLIITVLEIIDITVSLWGVIVDCFESGNFWNAFIGISVMSLVAMSAVAVGAVAINSLGLASGLALIAATAIVDQASQFITEKYKSTAGCK